MVSSPGGTTAVVAAGTGVSWLYLMSWWLTGPLTARPAQGVPLTAVFVAGLVLRPAGGLLVARLAPARGLRPSLMLTALLLAGGGLLIGFVPTQARFGLASGVLLAVATTAQLLAAGGEYAAAATYLTEFVPPWRRGRATSWTAVSATAGVLLAGLITAPLAAMPVTERLASWQWRLPFVLGGVAGLVLFAARALIPETGGPPPASRTSPGAPPARDRSAGPWTAVRRDPVTMIRIAGLAVGGGTAFATLVAFGLPMGGASALLGRGPSGVLAPWLGACLVLMVVLPLLGELADRYGPRRQLIGAGTLFAALALPVWTLLGHAAADPLALFVVLAVVYAAAGLHVAAAPAAVAELLPGRWRAAGFGVPCAIADALAGGLAPQVTVLAVVVLRQGWLNPWHLIMVTSLITLVAALPARRAARPPAAERPGTRPGRRTHPAG